MSCTFTAFPGHAGHCRPLTRWRSFASVPVGAVIRFPPIRRAPSVHRLPTSGWPRQGWRRRRRGRRRARRSGATDASVSSTSSGSRSATSKPRSRLASRAATSPPARRPSALPAVDGELPDVAALNPGFEAPTVERFPAGTVFEHHVVGEAACSPLVIDIGEDSEVTSSSASRRRTSRCSSRGCRCAAQAARVRYLAVNDLSYRARQLGHLQAVGTPLPR
jgi:hypothetical protein